MKKETALIAALVVAIGAAVGGGIGPAVADEYGDEDVAVNVDIEELPEPGILALTVAGTQAALTEEGSTALIRQFSGTLPTVTVTDTRTAEEIPDGAFWYVLGSASAFVGDAGQEPIGAENLGWSPRLVTGSASDGVIAGDDVGTALDAAPNNGGLVDQELLAMALDSEAVAGEGTWSATADLVLRTAATVEPGSYTATLTLSLFE